MQEVISIAASQALGHLVTQLYNVQESFLPYLKNAELTHKTEVFLEPSKHNGRVNYYPRCLNIQFSGGFGFLGKHLFHEPSIDLSSFTDVKIEQKSRVEKNQFQEQLDEGKPGDALLLNTDNTNYWTDYNKLIYRPYSLMAVEDYSHPNGVHKHFERLKFDNYNVGAELFKSHNDEIDESFRGLLESLDNIQGINVFSELDNGWGGFTNEMLLQLQDEYFNNGTSSKYNIWCFGLASNEPTREQSLSRTKAVVEFSRNCTLFFPLGFDQSLRLLHKDFQSSSIWHKEAARAYFVNSIWSGVNSLLEGFSMAELENNLLKGFDKRNIVNEMRIHSNMRKSGPAIIDDPRIIEAVLRGESLPTVESSVLDLSLNATSTNSKSYAKQYIIPKDEELKIELGSNTYINPDINGILSSNTFPNIFDQSSLYTEFGQSTSLKDHLKQEVKMIQRIRSPKGLEIIGDKEDLVEGLYTLIEEYTQGYELEDDWD